VNGKSSLAHLAVKRTPGGGPSLATRALASLTADALRPLLTAGDRVTPALPQPTGRRGGDIPSLF